MNSTERLTTKSVIFHWIGTHRAHDYIYSQRCVKIEQMKGAEAHRQTYNSFRNLFSCSAFHSFDFSIFPPRKTDATS